MPTAIVIAKGRTFQVNHFMHMGVQWFVAYDTERNEQSQPYGHVKSAAGWLARRGTFHDRETAV